MMKKAQNAKSSYVASVEDKCVKLTSCLTISGKNIYSKPTNASSESSPDSNSSSSSPASDSNSKISTIPHSGTGSSEAHYKQGSSSNSSENEECDSSSQIKTKTMEKIFKNSRQHPPNPDALPPCRVCGEKASGLHYGVNTCEPCKGFFRRSIVKVVQNKEVYTCIRETNKCKLGTGKRTMCSYCRYQKCLEVGMSQDAIKIGRYTYNKRNKDYFEVKKLKSGEPIEPEKQQENQESRIVPFHKDFPKKIIRDIAIQESEVDTLVNKLITIQEDICDDFREGFKPNGLLEKQLQIYETHLQKLKIFGNLGPIPKSVYDEIHDLTGLEIDDRNRKMNLIAIIVEKYILSMIQFARGIPGFSNLTPKDQASLLKAGFLEYWFLVVHNRIHTEMNVVVLGNIGLPGENGTHLSEFAHTVEGKCNKTSEYAAILQKCQFTVEELVLTLGIVLTFTGKSLSKLHKDRCALEEVDKIEKIQWNLINSLRCICKRKHKNPDERIWQIFDKFPTLRNYAEYAKEINKVKVQWPVMQKFPIVLEILSPENNAS